MTTFRDDTESHPLLDYPGYKSTRLRHPKQPLIILPHTMSELSGPVYGHEVVQEVGHARRVAAGLRRYRARATDSWRRDSIQVSRSRRE